MIQRKQFRVSGKLSEAPEVIQSKAPISSGISGMAACGSVHLRVSGMQVTRTKGSYGILWAEDGTGDS